MSAALKECPFCGGKARHLSGQIGFYSERVICDACDFYLSPAMWNARAIAPPVASGSVDTAEFQELMHWFRTACFDPGSNLETKAVQQTRAAIVAHVNAWGAQQHAAGYAKKISDAECGALAMLRIERERAEKAEKQWDSWMACANHWQGRAEKAEAELAVELERVQDYYTRWRCERENPTNTHRLDTWQAACGKARAERDKAEARIKELEAALAAAKPYDLNV